MVQCGGVFRGAVEGRTSALVKTVLDIGVLLVASLSDDPEVRTRAVMKVLGSSDRSILDFCAQMWSIQPTPVRSVSK